MGVKLTQLLIEDDQRIIHGNFSKIKLQALVKQGYKPYQTKDGKLIPVTNLGAIKIDYDKGYEDNTIYMLSDKELALCQRTEKYIQETIELKLKSIDLLKQYLPAFVEEIIKKDVPQ